MKILVSGSTGLIGNALVRKLKAEGHEVWRLTRSPKNSGDREVIWNPAEKKLDAAELEGVEGVVHLAGENLMGLWTEERKAKIRDSRVQGTHLLAQALADLQEKPRVMISSSAMGYYGSRGDEQLTEESGQGKGFLADVCRQWELAAEPARQAGIRVVYPRTSLVLSGEGGALKLMLPAFRMGLGGVVGDGSQYMSWITREDLVRAFLFALDNESVDGPLNAASPHPVTNRAFTETMGRVLHRPTIFRAPTSLVELAGGAMAEEMLLASIRLVPARLIAEGFHFEHPHLESALRSEVAKNKAA